jgi:hypothetical protein
MSTIVTFFRLLTGAQFTPKWGAQFAPKYTAHFKPKYYAQFVRNLHTTADLTVYGVFDGLRVDDVLVAHLTKVK